MLSLEDKHCMFCLIVVNLYIACVCQRDISSELEGSCKEKVEKAGTTSLQRIVTEA